ncbi:hypothetical protein [Streptomyces sp. NPDC053069]|uniref:hypothetical protein n=1 Tax=Streptomyces sp. NPDC053069 TaxID=3365695 RepID=UPI0037D61D75
MATVTFRDETATGRPVTEREIAGLPEGMTVRELIRIRVRETDLNGYRLREPRRIESTRP